jgi:hypothetical protein
MADGARYAAAVQERLPTGELRLALGHDTQPGGRAARPAFGPRSSASGAAASCASLPMRPSASSRSSCSRTACGRAVRDAGADPVSRLHSERGERAGRAAWQLAPALLLAALVAAGCKAPSRHPPDAGAGTGHAAVDRARCAVLLRGWIGDHGRRPRAGHTDGRSAELHRRPAQGPYRLRGLDDRRRGAVRASASARRSWPASPAGPGHHFMLVAPVGVGGSLALAVVAARCELDAAAVVVQHRAGAVVGGRRCSRRLRGLQLTNLATAARRQRAAGTLQRFELLQLREPVTRRDPGARSRRRGDGRSRCRRRARRGAVRRRPQCCRGIATHPLAGRRFFGDQDPSDVD